MWINCTGKNWLKTKQKQQINDAINNNLHVLKSPMKYVQNSTIMYTNFTSIWTFPGLSIIFKSTSTSLFSGGTYFIKIWTILMNILCNKILNQEVPMTILGG